jgi:hypothetical protein
MPKTGVNLVSLYIAEKVYDAQYQILIEVVNVRTCVPIQIPVSSIFNNELYFLMRHGININTVGNVCHCIWNATSVGNPNVPLRITNMARTVIGQAVVGSIVFKGRA